MGNTLHTAQLADQADCNKACLGDATELCGGEQHIQVYQDSTWFDPTASQLAAAFQEYNDTLAQALDVMYQYQSALQEWQSATKTSKLRRLVSRLQPRQGTVSLNPRLGGILRKITNLISTTKLILDTLRK